MTTDHPTTTRQANGDRKRHDWKWLLAAGCGALLLLGLIGAGAIGTLVFGTMKRSDVYSEAVERARTHPEAVAVLGEPVEPGWWLSGSISVSGPGGEASLAIPLSGPKGAGKLYVEADKVAGLWRFSTLELAPRDGGSRIDLLAESSGSGGAAGDSTPVARRRVGEITFSRGITEGEPVEAAVRFRSPLPAIYASFQLGGLTAEDRLRGRWYRGGRLFEEVAFPFSEPFPGGVPEETGFFLSLDMDEGGGLKPGFYRLEIALDGTLERTGVFVVEPPDDSPRMVNLSFASAVAEVEAGRRYPVATTYRFAAGAAEVYALFDFFGMVPGTHWGWTLSREGAQVGGASELSWDGPGEGIYALPLPSPPEPGIYDLWLDAGGEAQATDSFAVGVPVAPDSRILLEDGFDDPASGWSTTSTETMRSGYDDGRFLVRLDQAEAFAWSTLGGRSFGDFVAEVDALALPGGEPVEYGVIVRSQGDSGFHAFLISSAGQAAVVSSVGERFLMSSPWADLPPDLRQGGPEPVRLRLLARGPELRFYVDGRLVGVVPEARWSSGEVGLIIGTRELPGARVAFDDFRLWSLAGAAAPLQASDGEGARQTLPDGGVPIAELPARRAGTTGEEKPW